MDERKISGRKGEEEACVLLAGKGYKILERNWRSGPLEIDIIAQKENILVIVEVKTRSTRAYGDPSSFVTKAQQRRLIKAANEYAYLKNCQHEIRFDIVSIFEYLNEMETDHIEEAFYPIVNKSKLI